MLAGTEIVNFNEQGVAQACSDHRSAGGHSCAPGAQKP